MASVVAGAAAAVVVDTLLFPLDTAKTRLQGEGLRHLGRLGLFAGLGPVLLGSAPAAAVFFLVYDAGKAVAGSQSSAVHVLAAAAGEGAACAVRVPVEVVKQRRQAGASSSSLAVARAAWRAGGVRGLYRGGTATLAREVPFSLIQFPLWEALKVQVSKTRGAPCSSLDSALCGAAGGAVAAALTNPMDVVKTRLMLQQAGRQEGALAVLARVAASEGWRGLAAGLLPRLLWISLGGVIFFGVYEQTLATLSRSRPSRH